MLRNLKPLLPFKMHQMSMAHSRYLDRKSGWFARAAIYSRGRSLGKLKAHTPLKRIRFRRISLAN